MCARLETIVFICACERLSPIITAERQALLARAIETRRSEARLWYSSRIVNMTIS